MVNEIPQDNIYNATHVIGKWDMVFWAEQDESILPMIKRALVQSVLDAALEGVELDKKESFNYGEPSYTYTVSIAAIPPERYKELLLAERAYKRMINE